MPQPPVPCILIVDDEPQIRRLFRNILEEVGYSVKEAGNGVAALRAVEDEFFDLVVLDLSMPEMDGFEFLRAVRNELPHVGVLVISGFMGGAMLSAAEHLGADATLEKLKAPERLLTTVCQVLDGYFQAQHPRP
jgi:CheY-like chemotaxis protein